VRDGMRPREKGFDATALPTEHPRRARAPPRAPPAPPGGEPRALRAFPIELLTASIQKGADRWAQRQSQFPPAWGFLFRHTHLHRFEGEGGRTAAAPDEGGAEDRTGGKDIFTAKERRAAPEEGGRAPAGDKEQGPRRRPPA
jgi:hypothetical protein